MNRDLTTRRPKVAKQGMTRADSRSFVTFAHFGVALPAVHGLHS